ncbi:MAG: efflux RND transporter periplasmic adaptor subunit [Thermodesulfobacteriota bacterium]
MRVREVRSGDLPLIVEAVGRLAAEREVTLAAEVGGRVASHAADVGDKVEADQVLVQLDRTDYELALGEAKAATDAARAQLDAAAKTYERFRDLLSREVVSKDEFDQLEAQFKSAQAGLARAEAIRDMAGESLKKTDIKAPFAGHVAARLVEAGQTLAPGQPVVTLVDLHKMRVKVWLAEKEIVTVDPDNPVSVTVEALPGAEFPGRIEHIGVKADPRTNTFEVEVSVENPDLALKSGLSARVRLTTVVLPQVILIPQSAVLYRLDRQEVFVADASGRAEMRQVKLGEAAGSEIRVLEGLAPGDRLVVDGGQYLKSGDPVRIVEAAGPEETGAADQPR